jgi:hypothetical protein
MSTNEIEYQLKINSKNIQIKILTDLLSQNKIRIPLSPPSPVDTKSLDDIMRETCSLFNKINQNSKMVYIENNTDNDYFIEEEDDEDEEIKSNRPRVKKTVKKITSNVNINRNLFVELFETMKTSRTHKKILSEYIKLKMATLSQIDIHSYIEILLEHYNIIEEICVFKGYAKKRKEEIMSQAFCPLDLRLLLTNGKLIPDIVVNVGQTFINTDDVDYLKQSLRTTIYYGNNKESLVENFLNYGTAVMTLKQNIDLYLVKQKHLVYLVGDDDNNDPFRYYFLCKETKNKKYWEMDCRLDEFISVFIKNIGTYLIGIFRALYHDVFHDNLYRRDFVKSGIILEHDCEQLLSNLCTLATYKEVSKLLRHEIKSSLSHIEDVACDVFVLKSDDKLLKTELEKRESDVDMDILTLLFDDLSRDDAGSLYSLYFKK